MPNYIVPSFRSPLTKPKIAVIPRKVAPEPVKLFTKVNTAVANNKPLEVAKIADETRLEFKLRYLAKLCNPRGFKRENYTREEIINKLEHGKDICSSAG